MRQPGRFVGRSRELGLLEAELEGGGAVLLLGEAGIGKTRLVNELVRRTSQRGTWCLVAACLPLATRLPLLPVVDLLRDAFALDEGARLEAALAVCPAYVREDLELVLPELGGPAEQGPAEGWRMSRLFAALVEPVRALAASTPLVLVVEDLHWADRLTQDLLTYVLARRPPGGPGFLLTARNERTSIEDERRAWLQAAVVSDSVRCVQVPALSQPEIAELVVAVRGAAPRPLVEELWRRAEGNAFFTEQLLAAGTESSGAVLTDELAELLRARVTTASPDERRMLELLAVAGRPLAEVELVDAVDLDVLTVQAGLHRLAQAELVRTRRGGVEARHALLGEAIVDGLLPSERADLHGRVATLLGARGDAALAGEIARHWELARQPVQECAARIRAAEQAEQIGSMLEAASAWERAHDLADDTARPVGAAWEADVLALHGLTAWEVAGDTARASALARRALDRPAGSAGPRAALRARYAMLHAAFDRARGAQELADAIGALEAVGPSVDLVESHHRLYHLAIGLGRPGSALPHLQRAVETGGLMPPSGAYARALASLGYEQMRGGDLEAGRSTLEHARAVTPTRDALSRASLSHLEVYVLLQLSKLGEAEEVGRAALAEIDRQGLGESWAGTMLRVNVAYAMLAAGRVEAAGALLDPVTDLPVTADTRVPHSFLTWVDVQRGRLAEAEDGQQALRALAVELGPETASEFARMRAELALWNGAPDAAAQIVVDALRPGLGAAEPLAFANLLVAGMRACADLAEVAADRRDAIGHAEARARVVALDQIAGSGGPEVLTEHAFFAVMGPLGLEWRAERARSCRLDAPEDWRSVRARWLALGWRHRAAYASWRLSQAALRDDRRREAVEALQEAWILAREHVPLSSRISTLARLARIPLASPSGASAEPQSRLPDDPWGLTAREAEVLRLLTEGLTNAQIGQRLYMSPKTASVHVTAILRKLRATNRAHAAAIAERSRPVHPGAGAGEGRGSS